MSEQKATVAEHTGNLPNAEYRRFEGMREYEALIDQLIPQTQRTIRIFDKALSREYNSTQRFEALRRFLLAGRANRLMIVLHETATLDRDCPRMIELLRRFSTSVKINETQKAAKHLYDPFVIFDASHYLHRFHYDYLRAAQGMNDVVGTQQLLDRYAEIWEASAPAVSANTTGL
ncbi:MAG TPA: hypothetical protein VFC14_21575 [Burkholderiales bacterium]|jgi:hypothetical protein|nr:hypothetical protein [Burkholderiales bacterium]